MFKLGEFCEDDAKTIAGYLKDALLKIDMRISIKGLTTGATFMEGRLSELKGQLKEMEKYEPYLAALKSTLSAGATSDDFRDRFFNEIDPSWKDTKELMDKKFDGSTKPSEEDKEKISSSFDKIAEWAIAIDFAENTLSLNDIEIGQEVGEKLNDPLLRIRVDPEDYDPENKLLKESVEVDLEKVYDVYVDEFSTLLFRDISEEFQEEYPDEFLQILALGMLMEDLVEEPTEGKIDLEAFKDRCLLELGVEEHEQTSITVNGMEVAEEIAKALEKNGVIKMKGNAIKWKS